jgi:hypothetical protein
MYNGRVRMSNDKSGKSKRSSRSSGQTDRQTDRQKGGQEVHSPLRRLRLIEQVRQVLHGQRREGHVEHEDVREGVQVLEVVTVVGVGVVVVVVVVVEEVAEIEVVVKVV